MIVEPVVAPLPFSLEPVTFEQEEILCRLPHGRSRLRIDKVTVTCTEAGQPLGIGTITVDPALCHDHFDENRGFRQILAGVEMEEAAAQTGGVLVTVISDRFLDHAMLFDDERTFRNQHIVMPGFDFIVRVWLVSPIEQLLTQASGCAQCVAYVGRKQVMTGRFGFIIADKDTYNKWVRVAEISLTRACR